MVRMVSAAVAGFVSLWLIAGCAARPVTPSAPTAMPTPTSEPVAAPTVPEPAPTATAVEPGPVDYTQFVAVEGNLYILGNPDAPVLLIDFSDFL